MEHSTLKDRHERKSNNDVQVSEHYGKERQAGADITD